MLDVKSLMIWVVTLAVSTAAIVYTDGVWWAIAIAWVTASGGAWCQHAGRCGS